MYEMYRNHATPLARVVQGIPDSWEPAVATATFDSSVEDVVWSPCNRFIAVAKSQSVEVLDAVTLSRLSVFEHSSYTAPYQRQLGFSPDGRCLTLSDKAVLISWDLQTGSPLGTIPLTPERSGDEPFSFKHSKDGKLIAVAYKPPIRPRGDLEYSSFICTYDHHSGRHVGSHCFPEGRIKHPIWTNDEYLRFATIGPKSIRIWQSPFTLKPPPVEVMSFPVPDGITDAYPLVFLPTPPRLAFTLRGTIQVWDLKASKLLQSEFTPLSINPDPPQSSFSSDGHFFAYMTNAKGVYVWKESPTGYLPHQRLPFVVGWSHVAPQWSPNNESIIVSPKSKIHRLHARDQVRSLHNVSAGDRRFNDFTLGFSPDQNFAVLARKKENTFTIIDLESGELMWHIDVGLEIDCVGMIEGTVVVVGEESIVTWNPPGGGSDEDRALDTSVNKIVRITILDYSPPSDRLGTPYSMSISPDLSRIAVTRAGTSNNSLEVDAVSTGSCLARVTTVAQLRSHFTRGGHKIWTGFYGIECGKECKIIEDSESGAIELKLQDNFSPCSEVFRESSSGYTVTDDWWVLSPSQKRLLWLPHRWRSGEGNREWGGQFLGLLDGELSEVVILEFLE